MVQMGTVLHRAISLHTWSPAGGAVQKPFSRIDLMEDAHYSVWALRFYALVSFAVLLNVDAV